MSFRQCSPPAQHPKDIWAPLPCLIPMVDLPRLCSLMLLIVPGTFLAGNSPPHAFVDQFQEVFRILSNVSPPSQHSIVWLPYVCSSQDSCCCCWFPGSAVGRHISLAFVDGLGLVVQPSARPPWAGSVLFVLGSGVTSAPISLGVLCCLSPLRSVQFLSGLLRLGICPRFPSWRVGGLRRSYA